LRNYFLQFHKDAFGFAFKKVFGIDASIDEIPHHGSTDKVHSIHGFVSLKQIYNVQYSLKLKAERFDL
jgi:hypothetical protein